jgi:hypothetical protein
MGRVLSAILIVLLVGGTILLFVRFLGGDEDTWLCENKQWVKHGNPSAPMPVGGCGEAVPVAPRIEMPPAGLQVDFSETGNLMGDKDQWTLVYEKPGAPALTALLAISGETGCLVNGVSLPCAEAKWNQGDRATVQGVKVSGGLVSVAKLEVESSYKKTGCPEWVNCMPTPDVAGNKCVIPPGCEGYTQKAY